MPYGEHPSGDKTMARILQAGFYWLTLFKDVHNYVWTYDSYQRIENWSMRNEMPLSYILEVEIFDVWGVISWELSHPPDVTNLSCSPWIMYPNG